MYSKVHSAVIVGMEGHIVTVEADISDGLPDFNMIGTLSTEVREASGRVRTALKNCGYKLPPKKVVINLAPADIPKYGNSFDMPIAAAVLASLGIIPAGSTDGIFFAGEIGLAGEIRPIAGAMVLAAAAAEAGFKTAFVPARNAPEAAVNTGIRVCGIADINEMVMLLAEPDRRVYTKVDLLELSDTDTDIGADLKDVRGQTAAKRAAEIAAAGMHNLLLSGPCGTGKSMIAQCIPGIMPALTLDECIDISKVYSICGLIPKDQPLIRERPFRSPHRSVTSGALTGGGRHPKPGELSLATHGVLFLDELPEMTRDAIETLRQPLEDHKIMVSRVSGSYTFPADFMLVAAMNPCPCGYFPDRNKCSCSRSMIERYQSKVSEPLLDRIDIRVIVDNIPFAQLNEGDSEPSSAVRQRVERARQMQIKRYKDEPFKYNSRIPAGSIDTYCPLSGEEKLYMSSVFNSQQMSARGYHRILKIARTIADLDGKENIEKAHLAEAVALRNITGTRR